MMKRILLGLVAFFLIVASVAFQPSAPVSAQEPVGNEGVCAANPDAPLDIVLTLDKSGSIDDQGVDPSGKRFDATDSFIDGLVDVADSGKEIAINVIFFNTEAQSSGWTDVTPAGADNIKQDIRQGWSNPTGETDHVNAFQESYNALEDRSDRCRIVVMFTDGIMDTGSGNVESDVNRALEQSQPCTRPDGESVAGSTGGERTVSEQANELGVTTFILLLDPASGAEGFQERLNATMTLFSAVTGDLDPPDVGSDYELQCETDLETQSGEILSANDVNRMLAQFYTIEDELGGGEQVLDECPQPFVDGTQPLPAGGLIDRLTIIDFDAEPGTTSTRSLSDFTIETPDGDTYPASVALEGETTNPIRWKLAVSDADALPAGWSLQSPDAGSYCVSLFERTDLAASLSTESGVIRLQENPGLETLDIAYSPASITGQVELSVDFDGTTASTETDRIDIPIPVAWAEDYEPPGTGFPPGTGTARALATELFQDMPVDITVADLQILDRTSGEFPKISCEASSVTLLEGDAPKSGAIDPTDTTCVVKPGASTGGEATFLTLTSVTHAPDATTDTSSATVRFTLADTGDGAELNVGEPVEISAETVIWVSVDGIENERTLIEDIATFTVSYEPTPGAIEEAGSDSIEITVDLKARANRLMATIATILLLLLFAIASMLLLWLFNRLTAKLPDGSNFFFQKLDRGGSQTGPGVDNNSRDMKAARSSHGTLQLEDVEISLEHPPVWKPLSDSVGIIHAAGKAVADPTGPILGSVPLGFSTLLIATHGVDRTVEYTALVPRRGPMSGIDGIRSIAGDETRKHRVSERLDRHDPEPVEEKPSGGGEPPTNGGSPGTPTPPDPQGNGPQQEPPSTPEPRPSGPRLPGTR